MGFIKRRDIRGGEKHGLWLGIVILAGTIFAIMYALRSRSSAEQSRTALAQESAAHVLVKTGTVEDSATGFHPAVTQEREKEEIEQTAKAPVGPQPPQVSRPVTRPAAEVSGSAID